jgi:hypothetical protein
MKTRILNTLSLCAVLIVCAASLAYAAPQCSIVPSSIPWDQSDESTWVSDTYQLTIQCMDGGSPVEGYQAKFDVSLIKGTDFANQNNKIATLTIYSTPTNSAGLGQIIVPLIHLPLTGGGGFIHICPFDDISCNGGVSSQSQSAQITSSKTAASFSTMGTTGCTNTNVLPGCCETTILVTCCTPNRSFTYCTTTTVENCVAGTTHPDPCTTITTTWKPDGICDYCIGQCGSTVIALSSFTAKASNGRVKLEWSTESEIDNAGFNIYRSETEADGYVKINSELIPAKGSETKGAKYVFTDNIAKNRKTYFYKLEDIDLNGTSTMHVSNPKSVTPRMILGILGK